MDINYSLEIANESGFQPIANLERDSYILGREADVAEIVVGFPAVSSQHAMITRAGDFWIYQDLESTNGSWINSEPLVPHQWYLLRCSDILQIADLECRLVATDSSNEYVSLNRLDVLRSRKLVVLKNDQYLAQYDVPDYGKALVIGGNGADLALEGDLFESPSLIIERQRESIVLYSVAKEFQLYVNDEEISCLTNLKDGDRIKLLNYTILFSDPVIPQQISESLNDTVGGAVIADLRDWSSDDDFSNGKAIPIGTVFGQNVSDDEREEHFSSELGALEGRGGRFEDQAESMSAIENKVILFVGVIFILIFLAILGYWLYM